MLNLNIKYVISSSILFGMTIFILFFSLAACSGAPMMINVDASKREFQVRLPANPTTGFQWTLQQYDKEKLKLLNSNYFQPNTRLMGAGGEMVYTFERLSTSSSSTNMVFQYARSFEPNKGKSQRVRINFIQAQ